MIDQNQLHIEVETNSPSVSFNNVTKLRQLHGDIVAAIHCIDASQNHSTQFVYFDGYVHESNGFRMDFPSTEQETQALLSLVLVLQSIPCLGPTAKNNVEQLMGEQEENKTTYFVFRVDLGLMPISNIYINCDGMSTLNEIISFIYQDDQCSVKEIY